MQVSDDELLDERKGDRAAARPSGRMNVPHSLSRHHHGVGGDVSADVSVTHFKSKPKHANE